MTLRGFRFHSGMDKYVHTYIHIKYVHYFFTIEKAKNNIKHKPEVAKT